MLWFKDWNLKTHFLYIQLGKLSYELIFTVINITGAYGNPFLAFVVQRHCIEGFVQSMPYVLVYFVAPMLATVVHLSVKDLSNVSAKKNEWTCFLTFFYKIRVHCFLI